MISDLYHETPLINHIQFHFISIPLYTYMTIVVVLF